MVSCHFLLQFNFSLPAQLAIAERAQTFILTKRPQLWASETAADVECRWHSLSSSHVTLRMHGDGTPDPIELPWESLVELSVICADMFLPTVIMLLLLNTLSACLSSRRIAAAY